MSSFVREHTRYPIEVAVRVRCGSWADYLELYTTNLSRGGVFVSSALTAPIGTEMSVELSLPDGSTLALRAEVVHVVGSEQATAERPAGMGLMFFDLDDETKQALEAMLTLARFHTRGAAKTAAPAPAKPVPPPTAAVELEPEPEPDLVPVVEPAQPPPIPAEAARLPLFGDVVEQSLLNELARRLDLKPHEQLGVEPNADSEAIAAACERLRERYAPRIFRRYAASTVEVVAKINDLITDAYRRMTDPAERLAEPALAPPRVLTPEEEEQKARAEEARRALRETIERRVEEACYHRDLNNLDEAIRAFENVLSLDRKNDYARNELRLLRERREARDAPKGGLIKRLLKRDP